MEYNMENNVISEEMGSNYITISAPWDSDNNYDISNIALDMEIKLLDAQSVYDSLSTIDNRIHVAGDVVTFKKSDKTMIPYVRETKLPMKHRLAIAKYLLANNTLLDTTIVKDGTIYTVKYNSVFFNVFVQKEGEYVWFNKTTPEEQKIQYYNKQFSLRTKTGSKQHELELEHPLYGDQLTGFPTRLPELVDELDDAIDLIAKASRIPELAHKIDELKQLLDIL